MKIELKNIKIGDLVRDYKNDGTNGVVAYGGFLDIRPPYQREFVYKEEQRNKVIDTVRKSFPLNVMYWVSNENDKYEVLDGQQRTISICDYVAGNFSVNGKYYHNLTQDEKDQIDNYELMIYFCSGSESEKLEWFKIINIAGEKLMEQELRNAIYTGMWLTDAKKHFSRLNCPAYNLAKDYLNGSSIRQDYLETALKWISHKEYKKINIEEYMSKNQKAENASEIWQYFQEVIAWVKRTFPQYRKEMKGQDWGIYYNDFGSKQYNAQKLENEIKRLIEDDDVTSKKGIYEYLLTEDEKHLNVRTFSEKDKSSAFSKQLYKDTGKATCPMCNDSKKLYSIDEMEADHILAWSKGGKTESSNCQMLCRAHNRSKSNK